MNLHTIVTSGLTMMLEYMRMRFPGASWTWEIEGDAIRYSSRRDIDNQPTGWSTLPNYDLEIYRAEAEEWDRRGRGPLRNR
jgi:hypothetical protein